MVLDPHPLNVQILQEVEFEGVCVWFWVGLFGLIWIFSFVGCLGFFTYLAVLWLSFPSHGAS